MDPDKVSDALYECETAIQSYTDRFSSHLKDRDMRHRDGEIVLVRTLTDPHARRAQTADCVI